MWQIEYNASPDYQAYEIRLQAFQENEEEREGGSFCGGQISCIKDTRLCISTAVLTDISFPTRVAINEVPLNSSWRFNDEIVELTNSSYIVKNPIYGQVN